MTHAARLIAFILFLVTIGMCLADEKKNGATTAPVIKKRIACVGDSITAGYGVSPGNAYPNQLGRMLGSDWTVANFGVSATTLLNNGDLPYQKQGAFTRALEFKPDIVIIMLGSNDTKPQNWKFSSEFSADYAGLIAKFAALESKPRIFVARPCVVLGAGAFAITEGVLKEVLPKIDAIAKESGAGLVDIHAATEAAAKATPGLIPDNVHPNAEGAAILSAEFYKAVTGKAYNGPSCIVQPKPKAATTLPATK